jgi:hypothetical protein
LASHVFLFHTLPHQPLKHTGLVLLSLNSKFWLNTLSPCAKPNQLKSGTSYL